MRPRRLDVINEPSSAPNALSPLRYLLRCAVSLNEDRRMRNDMALLETENEEYRSFLYYIEVEDSEMRAREIEGEREQSACA